MIRFLGWCMVIVVVGYLGFYGLRQESGTMDAAYCAPTGGGPQVYQAAIPGVPNIPLPLPKLLPPLTEQAPKVLPDVPKLESPWVAVPKGLARIAKRLATDPPSDEAVRGFVAGVITKAGVAVGAFTAELNDAPDPANVQAFYVEQQQVEASRVQQAAAMCSCAAPVPVGSSGAAVARAAASAAGFTGQDLDIAVAVAGAESDYVPTAANPTSTARGMWQIMLSVHADKVAGRDWRDPYQNAEMAYAVWREAGGSWSPWTTYTSGAYKRFLGDTETAPAAPGGCANGGGTLTVTAPTLCPASNSPAERGLSPAALTVLRCGAAQFPQVSSFGGVGARGNASDHPSGNAVDFMVPAWQSAGGKALGGQMAAWFVRNADALHLKYVIWDRAINGLDGRGWRPYVNPQCSSAARCGATLQHLDHVHVSVKSGPIT